jgi:hypothetical protein
MLGIGSQASQPASTLNATQLAQAETGGSYKISTLLPNMFHVDSNAKPDLPK